MGRARILDPDICLALRKEWGSWGAATRALAEAGVRSPQTGEPFSRAAVQAAAKKAKGFKLWDKRQAEKIRVATEKVENSI